MTTGVMHTFEHLFATYVRNMPCAENIIYVGPMGCRTGFYFIVRDSVTYEQALRLIKQAMDFIAEYRGEIPGATHSECGNYLDHDLEGARLLAVDMQRELAGWTTEKMKYPN